jgi:lactoylglutathione lyase
MAGEVSEGTLFDIGFAEGAMKVKYATIIVRSTDESIEFYSDVMGFEVDSQFKPLPGVVITLMKGPGEAMVELIENDAYEVGLYSVGMDVDDLEATVERLKAKGATITMEPVATQVGSLAFVEDPNGARIALIEHR